MCVEIAAEQRRLLGNVRIGRLGKPGQIEVLAGGVTPLVTEVKKARENFAAWKKQLSVPGARHPLASIDLLAKTGWHPVPGTRFRLC
jgi:hypothetical protein